MDCCQQFDILKYTVSLSEHSNYIVAIITGQQTHKIQAYQLGAKDYISHPIIHEELCFRVNAIAALIQCKQLSHSKSPRLSLQRKIDTQPIYDRYALLVEKTCQYLLDNLAEKHSLKAVSALMLSNRNSLSKAFKKELGMGVFAWLRLQRMKQAKVLLETSDDSIQIICAQVGYEDPANFSTSFRAIYGMSPNSYRKLCTQQKEQ